MRWRTACEHLGRRGRSPVRTSRAMTSEQCLVGTGPLPDAPALVPLHHLCALDPQVVGNKAAALARAVRLRLPVLPGAVLTTEAPACALLAGDPPEELRELLAEAAEALASD